jgi:hypothetical protein
MQAATGRLDGPTRALDFPNFAQEQESPKDPQSFREHGFNGGELEFASLNGLRFPSSAKVIERPCRPYGLPVAFVLEAIPRFAPASAVTAAKPLSRSTAINRTLIMDRSNPIGSRADTIGRFCFNPIAPIAGQRLSFHGRLPPRKGAAARISAQEHRPNREG